MTDLCSNRLELKEWSKLLGWSGCSGECSFNASICISTGKTKFCRGINRKCPLNRSRDRSFFCPAGLFHRVRCTSCFASNATSIRFALRFQVTVLAWLFPVRLLIYIINFVDKIKFTLFVHFLLTCLLACLEVASYRYSFGSSRVGEEKLRDEPKECLL